MKLNGPLVPPRIAAVCSALQICVFLGKEQVAQRESKTPEAGNLDLGAVFYPDLSRGRQEARSSVRKHSILFQVEWGSLHFGELEKEQKKTLKSPQRTRGVASLQANTIFAGASGMTLVFLSFHSLQQPVPELRLGRRLHVLQGCSQGPALWGVPVPELCSPVLPGFFQQDLQRWTMCCWLQGEKEKKKKFKCLG